MVAQGEQGVAPKTAFTAACNTVYRQQPPIIGGVFLKFVRETPHNTHGALAAEFQPPADFSTCRQQAFEIGSLQSTEIHPVTARPEDAVLP